jgi:TonB family protein
MPILRRLTGTAIALLLSAAAQGQNHAQTPEACSTRDKCLDAIMDAARSGRQLDEMALMRALPVAFGTRPPPAGTVPNSSAGIDAMQARSDGTLAAAEPDPVLAALRQNPKWLNLPAAERRHALVRAYLQAGLPAQAELELDEAIANDPAYAPWWLDLAEVYVRQGRRDKAAAALVVATDWTADAAALKQSYAQAAQHGTDKGSGQDVPYAEALQLLAARTATLAQREAALAPKPLTKKPDGTFEAMPTMLFDSCRRPNYPRSSLRNEETGRVTLEFLVDPAGKPVQIRKVRSSGHAALDNATLLSLSACSFEPLSVDGKPAAAWAIVQYVWTLE